MASAMAELDEDSLDAAYTDDIQQSLGEFVCTHTLPQSVAVTRGSFMSQDAMIARGDVLLLHALGSPSVTLSFVDNGQKREMDISPNIPHKFLALPPKESALSDAESGGSGRPLSMVTYPTVSDLVMDCPTYFEANSTFDDPYLPGFSIKPGDAFRYVKVVKDVAGEKAQRLQCRTSTGELVCLSMQCRGNFTVLKDDNHYTLQELIELASVPRRLKLAENCASQLPETEEQGENTECIGMTENERLLLSFKGVITMARPVEKVQVSPWDSPDICWFLPRTANLYVKMFSDTEYEEPVLSKRIKPEALAAFTHEHSHKFPVHATLFAYTTPPDVIAHCLKDCREIIVHETLKTKKLFVKDSKKDVFFAIDKSVKLHFVDIPRTLSSVYEMTSLPLGSEVRVLADIAADFPEPFILRYGDVLRVTRHDSSSWKLKHNSIKDVPIVKCERIVQGGKPHKLRLPLDLEVSLVLLEDPSQLQVTSVADLLSGEDQIPSGNVSVLEGNGASFSPLPASIQILQALTETELLISPLSVTAAICPLIKSCVKIPLRHQVLLGLKRKLEFPDGYFVLPPKQDFICTGIEPVEENVYEELVQAQKIATEYEDVEIGPVRCGHDSEDDTKSQASSTGRSRHAVSSESIPRSVSSGTLEKKRKKDRVRRISQALNPKNWHMTLSRGAVANDKKPEEEAVPPTPPTPVSGILTLSLQPLQATDNDYTLEHFGEGSGSGTGSTEQSFLRGRDAEYFEDDPYEDVNISVGCPSTSASMKSQQDEQVKQSCNTSNTHAGSSTASSSSEQTHNQDPKNKVSTSSSVAGEESQQSQELPDFDRPRPRQRRGRGENTEGVARHNRHRRRKSEPCIGLLERKNRHQNMLSPDRPGDMAINSQRIDLKDQDLEKAPPIRGTRSPFLLEASDTVKKSPSLEDVRKASQEQVYSLLAKATSSPARSRKLQTQCRDREKAHHQDREKSHPRDRDRSHHHSRERSHPWEKEKEKSHPKDREHSDHHPSEDRESRESGPRKGPGVSSPPPERPDRQRKTTTPTDIAESPRIPDRRRKTKASSSLSAATMESATQAMSPSLDHATVALEQQKKVRAPGSPRTPEHQRKHRVAQAECSELPSQPKLSPIELHLEKCRTDMNTNNKSDQSPTHTYTSETHRKSAAPGLLKSRAHGRHMFDSSDQSSSSTHTPERQRKSPSHERQKQNEYKSEHSKETDLSERRPQVKAVPVRHVSPPNKPSGVTSRDEGLKNSVPSDRLQSSAERPQRQRENTDRHDDVVRPRLPRKHPDGNTLLDKSLDIGFRDPGGGRILSGSTATSALSLTDAKAAPERRKVKPAVPPKPVASPSSTPPHALKPAQAERPVAPPRRRAARIGSTEAEMHGEGGAVKPVIGRRRMP